MKEEINCELCQKLINKKKEFAILDHMDSEDKLRKRGYYHVACFRDRLHGGQAYRAISAKADWILNEVAKKI